MIRVAALLSVWLVFLLAACSPGEKVQNAPSPGDVLKIEAFEWHVVDQKTLEERYVAAGELLASDQTLDGFVGVKPDGTKVMFTLPPRNVDDRNTLVIGHEFLHVALDGYHR